MEGFWGMGNTVSSYSTVPAYKTASLWYRMEAFDDVHGTSAALAMLFPPPGSRLPPQGWLYTSKDGQTEVHSSEVKISFELKSPLTSKVFTFLSALLEATPGTALTAAFTAFTHFGQQRWTFSTFKAVAFASLAPLLSTTWIAGFSLLPK